MVTTYDVSDGNQFPAQIPGCCIKESGGMEKNKSAMHKSSKEFHCLLNTA